MTTGAYLGRFIGLSKHSWRNIYRLRHSVGKLVWIHHVVRTSALKVNLWEGAGRLLDSVVPLATLSPPTARPLPYRVLSIDRACQPQIYGAVHKRIHKLPLARGVVNVAGIAIVVVLAGCWLEVY